MHANMEPGSALEEQLTQLCRLWYLQADDLLLAYQRLQGSLDSRLPASLTATGHTGSTYLRNNKPSSKQQTVLQQLLQLHAQGLQDAVASFIDFSETTRWHVVPDMYDGGLASQQHPNISTQTWWQIVDSEMLRRTVQVLELVRVPHTTHGFAPGQEHLQRARHSVRVGQFHDTLLRGIAVLLAGLQLAAHELWRPCLEQIMLPRDNGFLLMLADTLTALCQVAHHTPFVVLAGASGGAHLGTTAATTTAATTTAASTTAASTTDHDPKAPEQSSEPAPAPAADTPTVPAPPHAHDEGEAGGGFDGFGSVLPTPCATRPSSAVSSLRADIDLTRGISSGIGGGPAEQQHDVAATFEAACDIQGSYISTSTAICVLRVLRDLNDLACNELSVRRGGAAGLNGLISIRQFLGSLVDLRAGLAALLHHTGILDSLVHIFRTCQKLGAPQLELVALLEGLVAVACTACSPDLPEAAAQHRKTNEHTEPRPSEATTKTIKLKPPVVALITEQIHQVIRLVSPHMNSFKGVGLVQLPKDAQVAPRLIKMLYCRHQQALLNTQAAHAGPHNSIHCHPTSLACCLLGEQYMASLLPPRPTRKEQEGEQEGVAEEGLDTSNLSEAGLLSAVVADMVAAVRIFACFAASDLPFFCVASDSWLPTLKAIARQCVSDGHTSLVKDITRVMCEVAAAMTHAMRHAAAAAAHADDEAQHKIFTTIKNRLAAGYVLAHDLQTEVFGRVMDTRGHPDRPYGWGAGAKTKGIHNLERHQVSMSTKRALYGGVMGGTGSLTQSPRLQPGASAASLMTQLRVPGQASLCSFSPRTLESNSCGQSPRRLTGASALLPSPRANTSATNSPRLKQSSAMSAGGATTLELRRTSSSFRALTSLRRRSDVLNTASNTAAATGAGGASAKLSELAPLWAALGYNADGQVLDMTAADLEEDEEQPEHWTGMPKRFVIHYEQLLHEVLNSILHLIRGYLLPVMWQRLPQPLAAALAAQGLHSQGASGASSPLSMSNPSRATHWGSLQRSVSLRSPKTADQWKKAGLPAYMSEPEAQPVPRHISILLGRHMFNGQPPPALQVDDTQTEGVGDVPESVICLMEELNQAGLMHTLEAVFSIELLTDHMYWSHAAAVDYNTASLAKSRDQGARLLDTCRLTCSCLIRDVLSNAPALAHDTQAALMLRSVRKFLNSTLQPHTTHAHAHPLSKFTRTTPSVDLLKPTEDLKPRESIAADWRDSACQHTHRSTAAAERHGSGMVDLTGYTVTSLAAMGLELLPLPRVLAARAEADQAPGLALGSKWVPNPSKVLSAGVSFIHVWSPFMSLLNILMHVMEAHERPGSHKPLTQHSTAGTDARSKARFSTDPGKLHPQQPTAGHAPASPAKGPAHVPSLKLSHVSSPSHQLSMHRRKTNFESITSVEGDTDRSMATSAYQQARQKASRFKGSHLAASMQFLAPLHRLLEAWVQQLTLLLQHYQHMEVLQACIEVGLLHSGAASFLMAILKGQHYSLTCRFQPTEPQEATPTRPTLNSLSPLLDSVASFRRTRGAAELASTWVIPETTLQKRRVQRDVDREYGLAGTSLVSLEELCCLVHQLCTRPALSAHLIITKLVNTLATIIISTLDTHLNANSNLVRTMAAASTSITPRSPYTPGSVSTPRAVGLSSTRDPASPSWTVNSPRPGGTLLASSEGGAGSINMESMAITAARYQYLTMPRAGHWMLACCSTAKRAACGMSFMTAHLAYQRLNTGAHAATAERYTTSKPNAGSQAGLPASAVTSTSAAPHEQDSQAAPKPEAATSVTVNSTASSEPSAAKTQTSKPGEQPAAQSGGNAAPQIRPADHMVLQQPQMLKQYCRQLLIACRNSVVGVELVEALTVLPGILEQACQLRSIQVAVQPMTAAAVQAALEAGVEIAAVVVGPGASKGTTALNSPAVSSRRHSHDGDEEAEEAGAEDSMVQEQSVSVPDDRPDDQVGHGDDQTPLVVAPVTAADSVAGPECGVQDDVQQGSLALPELPRSPPKPQRPQLAIQIPQTNSAVKAGTALAAASPRSQALDSSKPRATSGLQGWESHASVLMCEELSDPSVLQEERLKVQRAQLEVVVDQFEQARDTLCELPLPSLTSACPVLIEKPHFLGCCNIHCCNLKPGQTEKDVSLHRCERCERAWYCCEACQLAAWPQHRQFCLWFEALQRL